MAVTLHKIRTVILDERPDSNVKERLFCNLKEESLGAIFASFEDKSRTSSNVTRKAKRKRVDDNRPRPDEAARLQFPSSERNRARNLQPAM